MEQPYAFRARLLECGERSFSESYNKGSFPSVYQEWKEMFSSIIKWIPSVVRFIAGTTVGSAIVLVAAQLYPSAIVQSPGGWAMTLVMAILVGVMVALPPLHKEEEWIQVAAKRKQEAESPARSTVESDAMEPVLAFEPPERRTSVAIDESLLQVPSVEFPGVPLYEQRMPQHGKPVNRMTGQAVLQDRGGNGNGHRHEHKGLHRRRHIPYHWQHH